MPLSGEAMPAPRPDFGLTIGVTGHRIDALPTAAQPVIAGKLAEVLGVLRSAALDIASRERAFFSEAEPRFTLVSPLADGADQIAAEAALELGFALQAVLPFERTTYADDFTDAGRARLAQLLGRAGCVLELPGERDDPLDAYIQAGRATVAHCDLLVAVWDGLPARGRGGTGEIVELALRVGTPIIHIAIETDASTEMLWSAFDPTVVTAHGSPTVRRPVDSDQVERLLSAMLAPPIEPRERQFALRFLVEKAARVRRLEYPLLLSLTGARRLRWSDWSSEPGAQWTAEEWQAYRAGCAGQHGVTATLDPLQRAYAWADRFATYYAQTYRSGHVFNFLFAALATLIGLSGLVISGAKMTMALAEFAVILLILSNTKFGTSRCWHQRWLDYRQLAERLRPMRSLKLLGVASPDPPGSITEPVARRWIDWYAAAMWRSMGCPSGSIDRRRAAELARSIGAFEVEPQISYNRGNAKQSERIDHRLESFATSLFAITVAACVGTIFGLVVDPSFISINGNLLTLVSAGLPAIGTAIFGIRVQGDYGGAAARASSTAEQLQRIAHELAAGPQDLGRSADLVEQAARVMLADLGNWRLIHEQHELTVG